MGAAGDGLEPRSRRRERQSFHRSTGRRGDRVFNIHIVPSAHPPSSSITRTPFAPPGKDVEWAGRAAAACELSHISPTLCLFLKVVKFMRVGGGFASPLIFAQKVRRQVYQSVTRTGLGVRLLGFGFQHCPHAPRTTEEAVGGCNIDPFSSRHAHCGVQQVYAPRTTVPRAYAPRG